MTTDNTKLKELLEFAESEITLINKKSPTDAEIVYRLAFDKIKAKIHSLISEEKESVDEPKTFKSLLGNMTQEDLMRWKDKEDVCICIQTGNPCGIPCYDKCPMYNKINPK